MNFTSFNGQSYPVFTPQAFKRKRKISKGLLQNRPKLFVSEYYNPQKFGGQSTKNILTSSKTRAAKLESLQLPILSQISSVSQSQDFSQIQKRSLDRQKSPSKSPKRIIPQLNPNPNPH